MLKRAENSRKRTMERDIPNQKCQRCGRPAKFLKGQDHYEHYSCSEKAKDCPGQSDWRKDIQRRSYENRANIWAGKTRPEHTEALLTDNKFGSRGQHGYWHRIARYLWWKPTCQICGKTEEEQLATSGKGLHMHCKSLDWTDMDESNWTCKCHACHIGKHLKGHPHWGGGRKKEVA